MVGKIYLAKIYFTDAQSYKLRPVLIIKRNSFNDYIYVPFTTQSDNQHSIKFTNSDLKSGNFKKISYLIVDKTCTIQPSLLTKEIAVASDIKFQEVLDSYCAFLKS